MSDINATRLPNPFDVPPPFPQPFAGDDFDRTLTRGVK